MSSKAVKLQVATPPEWVDAVLSDFDAFLVDHANCERKASALAMSLVVKYPDRTAILPGLITLAQEELQHFAEAYALMECRGLRLGKDIPDPYVNQLLKTARHGRDERFIDRMLLSSVIEARGAERFGLLAENLTEPEIGAFYTRLWKSEVKHAHVFVHLLMKEFDADQIYARLDELAAMEARVVQSLELRPALH